MRCVTEISNAPSPLGAKTVARAVGARSASAALAPLEIERRAIGANDVRIDIKFCGICNSDIHFARGEWGEIPYPAIPGHEIAGIVSAVGEHVSLPEGDAVVLAHQVPADSVVVRMSATGQVSPCSRAAVCGARRAYASRPGDSDSPRST